MAITGLGHSRIALLQRSEIASAARTCSAFERLSLNCEMSAPEMNALSPSPFRITTRIAGSLA